MIVISSLYLFRHVEYFLAESFAHKEKPKQKDSRLQHLGPKEEVERNEQMTSSLVESDIQEEENEVLRKP